MSDNLIEINLSIIYSEWDDALGSVYQLSSKKDIIYKTAKRVTEILQKALPEEKACSLVIGTKV